LFFHPPQHTHDQRREDREKLANLLRIQSGRAPEALLDWSATRTEDVREDCGAGASGISSQKSTDVVENAAVMRAERVVESFRALRIRTFFARPPRRMGSAIEIAFEVAAVSVPSCALTF
jgi:hypothetical protein